MEDEMYKVTNGRLQELRHYVYTEFLVDNEDVDYKKCHDIQDALFELQSLRKIDIAKTLKYAEEAGAACEEMKYGIEAVIEEISIVASRRDGDQTDFKEGFDAGLRKAVKRIQKHLSKYLDE